MYDHGQLVKVVVESPFLYLMILALHVRNDERHLFVGVAEPAMRVREANVAY